MLFPGPHSYTGEDCAEIHCHGSPVVLQEGLRALFAAGARQAARSRAAAPACRTARHSAVPPRFSPQFPGRLLPNLPAGLFRFASIGEYSV